MIRRFELPLELILNDTGICFYSFTRHKQRKQYEYVILIIIEIVCCKSMTKYDNQQYHCIKYISEDKRVYKERDLESFKYLTSEAIDKSRRQLST